MLRRQTYLGSQVLISQMGSSLFQAWIIHYTMAFILSMRRHGRLTHLSQFISPPIPQDAERNFHGTGARLIAAVLASLLPGIAYVGLVAQDGKIRLYCNGIDIIQDELTDG